MTNVLTSEKVKEFGSEAGAEVVGIASSADFGSAPDGFRPSNVLEGCLSVIVLGSPFPQDAILNDPAKYIDVRNEMNEKMNEIAKEVASRIKDSGRKARAVGGISGKWVNGKQHGYISLKHAAELAGLGVIGRNYLLTNEKYGNLLWFSAVLTDAPLVPDEKAQYTVCDNCNKCVETCPSKALSDPSSFGKKVCSGAMFQMANGKWELRCFLCRKVCPHRFGADTEG